MLDASLQERLLQSTLLVISERVAKTALALGFQQAPLITKEASDAAIVTAIIEWKNAQRKIS